MVVPSSIDLWGPYKEGGLVYRERYIGYQGIYIEREVYRLSGNVYREA